MLGSMHYASRSMYLHWDPCTYIWPYLLALESVSFFLGSVTTKLTMTRCENFQALGD
jgi:hypothetical protein